jgi:predicted small lipoprotein YifL
MKKWLPYILMAMLSFGLTACGKKGPPVPPDDEPKEESPYPDNREDRGTRR